MTAWISYPKIHYLFSITIKACSETFNRGHKSFNAKKDMIHYQQPKVAQKKDRKYQGFVVEQTFVRSFWFFPYRSLHVSAKPEGYTKQILVNIKMTFYQIK